MGKNNWQVKTFEEIFELKQGKHLPLEELNDGAYPVFGANGMVGHYDKFMYQRETLLVTCRGATCGSINLTKPNSWVTGNAIALVPKDEVVNSFFYFQLKDQSFRDVISGSAQPQIIVGSLKNKKVFVPPIPIQRQIAEILEQADKAKQKRKEANKLTDEFLQSVFIEMFGDPIHNQKGYPIKELKTLTVENINYGVVQPGEVVNDGVPIIRVGDFEGLKISKLNLKKISFEIESAYVRSRIIGDEVLIACVGSIGKVALVDISLIGYNTVRAVARVRVNENLERLYLAHYLSLPFIQEYFIRQTRTVSQPTLNIKQIAETPVILPPLLLQKQFAEIVNKTEALKEKQKQSEQELENLFQSLMQKVFKGELV